MDFEENPELVDLFATNDVLRIRQDIEVFFYTKFIDGKTGTLKSLQVYMYEKKLETAVRFNTNLPAEATIDTFVRVASEQRKVSFNLVSLPLYMVSEYKRIINSYNP